MSLLKITLISYNFLRNLVERRSEIISRVRVPYTLFFLIFFKIRDNPKWSISRKFSCNLVNFWFKGTIFHLSFCLLDHFFLYSHLLIFCFHNQIILNLVISVSSICYHFTNFVYFRMVSQLFQLLLFFFRNFGPFFYFLKIVLFYLRLIIQSASYIFANTTYFCFGERSSHCSRIVLIDSILCDYFDSWRLVMVVSWLIEWIMRFIVSISCMLFNLIDRIYLIFSFYDLSDILPTFFFFILRSRDILVSWVSPPAINSTLKIFEYIILAYKLIFSMSTDTIISDTF